MSDLLRSSGRLVEQAYEMGRDLGGADISQAVALFSGGHDSLVATHVAHRLADEVVVVHINTGIGIPETRQFVREACDQLGWDLRTYCAQDYSDDCKTYEELVTDEENGGFPGPGMHYKMYSRLKERALDAMSKDIPPKRLLLSGIRKEESHRRMNLDNPVNYESKHGRVWCNLIFEWSARDCQRYMDEHDLPHNPVKDVLGMSGECLCGAYAEENELVQVRSASEEAYQRIRSLEDRVREAGYPWGWEHPGPPEWWTREQHGQLRLSAGGENPQPMCMDCRKRRPEYEPQDTHA